MGQFFITSVTSHFNLRHHNNGKPSPLYLVVRINQKQYKIPMGVKVLPEHWKGDKAIVASYLSNLDNKNNKIVNDVLLDYQIKALSLQQIISNNADKLGNVGEVLNEVFEMKRKVHKQELAVAVMRRLLLEQPMKESSKDAYLKEITCFEQFTKTLNKTVCLEGIDVPFMREYIKYLRSIKDTHKITHETVCIEDNTVASKFKKILTILTYADKADLYDVSKVVKLKDLFKNDKTEENQVFLNDEEITRIMGLSLKGEMEAVRDIFIFQMETGQRISDIMPLMGNTISVKDDKIVIIQEKTQHKVTPPITPTIQSILDKYNYTLPILTLTKINTLIKKVCELAHIDDMCDCVELRGGKPYKYSCEKYRLVASHTCRRSFISNSLKDGIDSSIIKKISGHSTDSAFQRYNRLSSEDAAETFAKIKNKVQKGQVLYNVPPTELPAVRTAGNGITEEIKRVLMMFEVPPVEWYYLNDEESLYRLLINKETEICDKLGCDYAVLKTLFNRKDITMKDKIEILKNMFNN